MLTCPQPNHPHPPCFLLPRTSSLCFPRCRNPPSATALRRFFSNAVSVTTAEFSNCAPDCQNLLRKHNARSTVLLLRHISPPTVDHPTIEQPSQQQQEQEWGEKEKVEFLEMSLVSGRSPKFLGSVSPGIDGLDSSSSSPLRRLFHGGDDEEMLLRALEIRRNVTAEILKQALARGKFGITYSSNLVAKLPKFIDHVMVEAASMTKLPEFSYSSYNVRARAVIDDSDVVPLIRWLKHHQLSFPQIGKLICMSPGNLDAIRRVVEWLKSMHVKGEFMGVSLMKAGDNILNRATEELDEIVGYLESEGVKRDWMGYVISRCPQLLSYSIEEVKARARFYLDMGMNEKDFGTMVYDYPKALGYLTLEEMNQKVNYIMKFGLDSKDVGWLLAFKPQLMRCSIEERWKPLIKYLYYLGIDLNGMKRILLKKPVIFCTDMEIVVVPKVRFLRDIGIQEDAIGKMLVKFPSLLTYSLYKKIRPVIIFLITKAGVSQKNIGKVLAIEPELLGCSIVHKLEVNVKYFLSLGIPLRELAEMIVDFPTILRYNVDLLRPKYRYLRRTMVRPLQDIVEFPRFFSYSLEDRIIPRHKLLIENRVNFKLRYTLACTDDEFDQRIKSAVERRRRFESRLTEQAHVQTKNAESSPEEDQLLETLESETYPFSSQAFACSTVEAQPSSPVNGVPQCNLS